MNELTCKTARRWLAAATELDPVEQRRLNRHLVACSSCAALRKANLEVDHLIRRSLGATVGGISVREQTRARLAEGATSSGHARPEWTGSRRLSAPRWLTPRRIWFVAPVALAAVLALVLVPQLSSHVGSPPVSARAAWKVERPVVAFPLTIDPKNDSHLLAGSIGQVYESWNAGASWHRLGSPQPGVIRALAIDLVRPNRYLVALRHSVLVSDDAGRHWSMRASGLPGAQNMFLLQDPRTPSRFYAGPSVLWRSDDRGLTWTPAGRTGIFAPDGIQALAIADNGDLYTGIWAGGVAVSHDGGRTWQRRANGLAPNVMDVWPAGKRIWAATDRGIYVTTDEGLHWRRSGPHGGFSNTSLLVTPSYLLAGGNSGIFRSVDNGRHWRVTDRGLPLAPYVYNLVADPQNPNRVYASLNGDGIFRSDDAGQSWIPVDNGIPLPGDVQAPRSVLFRRHGTLWITDGRGTDPGVLTVDQAVVIARASPDGGAVAYVNGNTNGWAARVVGASGSAAQTIAEGSGSLPSNILWSPTSSALALPTPSTVFVLDFHAGRHSWPLPAGEHLLAWSRNGKSLLLWQARSGIVFVRDPATGVVLRTLPGVFPGRPVPAPDGKHVAFLSHGTLLAGTLKQPPLAVSREAPGCTLGPWSDDSTRLLVTCSGRVEERTVTGKLAAVASLPARPRPFWAPGSDTDLLYFHHGLWRWTPGKGARLIVSHAASAQPLRSLRPGASATP